MATIEANFYDIDGVLYFHLMKPSTADINAVPFVFEGLATPEHIKNYAAAYEKYLADKQLGA